MLAGCMSSTTCNKLQPSVSTNENSASMRKFVFSVRDGYSIYTHHKCKKISLETESTDGNGSSFHTGNLMYLLQRYSAPLVTIATRPLTKSITSTAPGFIIFASS
ncbi:uncharacterized protein LOC112494256 [Cephus cinctus]|uniref:Uncharacterized protein LOC112494256 n=1 Tax=Cephus cinctus TaxID=211228 RepID=A0AAJ7RGF5_CEPCN|nr:uncharacterized protein LOC112494256 [Cephus cinctus]